MPTLFCTHLEQHGSLSEFSHCPSKEAAVSSHSPVRKKKNLLPLSHSLKIPVSSEILSIFLNNLININFDSRTGNT